VRVAFEIVTSRNEIEVLSGSPGPRRRRREFKVASKELVYTSRRGCQDDSSRIRAQKVKLTTANAKIECDVNERIRVGEELERY
jgi:hypothetical protein